MSNSHITSGQPLSQGRRWFLRLVSWSGAAGALTVVLYLVAGRDGAASNWLGVFWLAVIAVGFVLLATYRGPRWAIPVFAVLQMLHPAAFVGLSYASSLLPVMGGGLLRAVLAPLLVLALLAVTGLALLEQRGPRPVPPGELSIPALVVLVVHGGLLAGSVAMTLHFLGIQRMAVFEYAYSFAVTASVTLLVAALAWRSSRRIRLDAARRVVGGVAVLVALFTVASYGLSLGSTVLAGARNENVASFATGAPSAHFDVATSIPLMLTGTTYDTAAMRTEHESNWYSGPKPDVVLGYDAYLPAVAEAPTPVIIRLHGINAPQLFQDTYYYMNELGYAVIDVQYGQDSGLFNDAAPNTTGEYVGDLDAWVDDMEYLLRNLESRSDELGLDLENLFIWGESYGTWMAVGMNQHITSGAYGDISERVTLRGMLLLYGSDPEARYYDETLVPSLFITGSTDGVYPEEHHRAMLDARDRFGLSQLTIMEAGMQGHSYNIVTANQLQNQVTFFHWEKFLEAHVQRR